MNQATRGAGSRLAVLYYRCISQSPMGYGSIGFLILMRLILGELVCSVGTEVVHTLQGWKAFSGIEYVVGIELLPNIVHQSQGHRVNLPIHEVAFLQSHTVFAREGATKP